METFKTKRLPAERDTVSMGGFDVRNLLGLQGGDIAHFELPAGHTSTAVVHKTVEEIWFFLYGRGEMWRKMGEHEQVVPVEAGMCLTVPLGTHIQVRCYGDQPLAAIGVVMPPWPGDGEALPVEGKWEPTV